MSLSGFVFRVMLPIGKQSESIPSASIFWKKFWTLGIISSLNVWQKSPVKPFRPSDFFRRLLTFDSIFIIDIGFIQIICSSLCEFWWVVSFKELVHFIYQVCGLGAPYNTLLSMGSIVMAPLLFFILVIYVFFLFFLFSLVRGLLILLTFSKNQLFSIGDFSLLISCF